MIKRAARFRAMHLQIIKKKVVPVKALPSPPPVQDLISTAAAAVPQEKNKHLAVIADLGHLRALKSTWLGRPDDHGVNDDGDQSFPVVTDYRCAADRNMTAKEYAEFWQLRGAANVPQQDNDPLPETNTLTGFGVRPPPQNKSANKDQHVTPNKQTGDHEKKKPICFDGDGWDDEPSPYWPPVEEGNPSSWDDWDNEDVVVADSGLDCCVPPPSPSPVPSSAPSLAEIVNGVTTLQVIWRAKQEKRRLQHQRVLQSELVRTGGEMFRRFKATHTGKLRVFRFDVQLQKPVVYLNSVTACWQDKTWKTGGAREAFIGGFLQMDETRRDTAYPTGIIMKRFKADPRSPQTPTDIKRAVVEDAAVQKSGQWFAQQWSTEHPDTPVTVVEPFIVCPLNERGEETAVWAAEQVLHGQWQKWVLNTGAVLQTNGDGKDVAEAFAHWSWCKSNQVNLVCDLQGVYQKAKTNINKNQLMLTDIAVSNGGGMMDWKGKSINIFFSQHVCNHLCCTLERPFVAVQAPAVPVGDQQKAAPID
eukprot:TRINITY_DN64348_c0_g1_i1.p1 TRINITY_DN64348_c0_g1~~TRINITY_DN64348_c0_g1_i1.p1  ORF type:complete len:531 (-),score=51.91 TRINITY_DN64348_c0_g1_i1:255-1847(-)